MFKRAFYLLFISILAFSPASFAQKIPADTGIKAMNIKDFTVRESTLWGLEVYRRGNYPEAVKVFQSILRKDCTNRLAQYHLQKIMKSGPGYAYLKDYLAKLPCQKYNFSEEDFLPASFYMEKDTDLMLEQLEAYNKRYLNSKAELSAKIAEYQTLAGKLEQRVNEMTAALDSTKKMSTETIKGLTGQLAQATQEAKAMSAQVAELKQTLNEEKVKAAADKAAANTAPAPSMPAIPVTVPAAAQTPTATEELTTLQAKFANIQQRLEQIETALIARNQQVESLKKNLEAVK